MKHIALAVLAVVLPALWFSPARSAESPARAQFHHVYPLAANGKFVIDDERGAIQVVGWKADRVQVDATLCAQSAQQLANMRVNVDSSPGAISVETLYPRETLGDPSWWQLFTGNGCGGGSMEVDYVIHVPVGASIDVATRSGDIDARDLQAPLNARSTSGDVRAQNVSDASLSSVSGDVTLIHEHGVCTIDATSGHTTVQNVTGSLTASSVSGEIDLDRVSGKAVVTTTSGAITAHAYRGVGRLRSVSGDVELTLVRGGGVSLSASSQSGDVRSDVPLKSQAPVDVQTVSGNISARFI